ncbi:MAG TPA: SDR family oxidoreductase [Phycisphaerae bacterium]|nr:SDR family oxidoreductase [Phycisphaerae bacterium]
MSLCLVTGGAGFIGSHLVRRLLAEGHAVRALDNFSTGHAANLAEVAGDIELVEGDIGDEHTAARCARGVDAVFHLAARASVPRSVEFPVEANHANVTGTLNLLVAARSAKVRRFIYSASSAAYGDTPTLPKVESMPPQPLSPYAVSKLAAEYYCSCFSHVYGLETISLRYFNIFGPRQDPKSAYAAAIPAFVSRMIRGERPVIYGDGEQSRDFCYVDNAVEANVLAMRAPRLAGEVVNIACGERITLNAIVALINQHLGSRLAPIYEPVRAGDVRHSLAALDAAQRIIGYRPGVMFAEGLARSLAWYSESATR